MRVTTLHIECIDMPWFHIVESKRSGSVLYLFHSAPDCCIANIIEIPPGNAGEIENNFIAGLMVSVEARPISGATLKIVTEAS